MKWSRNCDFTTSYTEYHELTITPIEHDAVATEAELDAFEDEIVDLCLGDECEVTDDQGRKWLLSLALVDEVFHDVYDGDCSDWSSVLAETCTRHS